MVDAAVSIGCVLHPAVGGGGYSWKPPKGTYWAVRCFPFGMYLGGVFSFKV